MIPENLLAKVRDTMSATNATRAVKKQAPNPSAWHRIWLDEMRKYYPAYVVMYSDAVAANLQRAIKHRHLPVEDVGRLIAWVIGNWALLRRLVFSFNPKVLRGPEAPDMELVIKYLPRIYGMFNSEKPEHALTAKRASPLASVPAPILPPVQNNAPALLSSRPKPIPLRPIIIDHAKADIARQKLGFKKWGE